MITKTTAVKAVGRLVGEFYLRSVNDEIQLVNAAREHGTPLITLTLDGDGKVKLGISGLWGELDEARLWGESKDEESDSTFDNAIPAFGQLRGAFYLRRINSEIELVNVSDDGRTLITATLDGDGVLNPLTGGLWGEFDQVTLPVSKRHQFVRELPGQMFRELAEDRGYVRLDEQSDDELLSELTRRGYYGAVMHASSSEGVRRLD